MSDTVIQRSSVLDRSVEGPVRIAAESAILGLIATLLSGLFRVQPESVITPGIPILVGKFGFPFPWREVRDYSTICGGLDCYGGIANIVNLSFLFYDSIIYAALFFVAIFLLQKLR